jgi:2-polyprenyl-3-methyl-5-hydroxy-6-metoxy-1,4-benzoquinol methylase
MNRTEQSKCLLCESTTFKSISKVDSKSSTKLLVGLCEECGLIQQTPPPTVKELSLYYSQEYRIDYKQSYSPKPKHVYRASKTARQRINFLHKSKICTGNLLDVGAGSGEFTYLAQRAGFKSKGVEPNIGYSEYARSEYSCNVITAEIDHIEGKYNVVTIFHVLEHLPDPIKAFKKLYYLLEENGLLFVEVPWIKTNDASPHSIFFKAHIIYFSEETLMACASQYFDEIEIDTSSNLKILFRAKKEPLALILPSPVSVKNIKKRMDEKGWFEYLFNGLGILKPMTKIVQGFEENRIKNLSGKQIIDIFRL